MDGDGSTGLARVVAAVVADDAELVADAARRRRPEVRLAVGGQAPDERHPAADGPVLDGVVEDRLAAVVDRRRAPADEDLTAGQTNGRHVHRRLQRPVCDASSTSADSNQGRF